uniref:Secreted protein n=1 Tax=Panagrolaimus sp. PS1159 TaxID=55785 RepID=A0AC35G083_9BILA
MKVSVLKINLFLCLFSFVSAQFSTCCNSNGLLGLQENNIQRRYPFYNRLFLRGNSFVPGTILGPSYGYNPNIPRNPFLKKF